MGLWGHWGFVEILQTLWLGFVATIVGIWVGFGVFVGRFLGHCWGDLGRSWGHFGEIFCSFGVNVGRFCVHLQGFGLFLASVKGDLVGFGAAVGGSWGLRHLARFWGHSGAVLRSLLLGFLVGFGVTVGGFGLVLGSLWAAIWITVGGLGGHLGGALKHYKIQMKGLGAYQKGHIAFCGDQRG